MNIPLRQYWDLLATYMRPQRGRVALLTVLLLVSTGLPLLNPLILRNFIDTAVDGGAMTINIIDGKHSFGFDYTLLEAP